MKWWSYLILIVAVQCCAIPTILIIDTYVTIPVSPRSRYTAVYRSSTKYRETVQVSWVLTIPCSSYHLATCTLQACDAEMNSKVAENHNYHSTTISARAAVTKYNPISYFCISAALLTTVTKLPISKTDLSGYGMAVWLSGNALASINVVALRQTRLVLRWVTVCGRVNHFGM